MNAEVQVKASEPIEVVVSEASVRFGDFQALKAVDMNIRPGELFTLLGPSGCGKTTLLRSIAGFNTLDGGKIQFNGQDVSKLPPWKRDIGFVFQNYALWPTKTIFENIAYGLKMRNVSTQEIKSRVEDVLELVELSAAAEKFPGQLSGGMQQRAALARAMVIDPPLMLLDEPLSNLDAKLRVSLRRGIRKLLNRLGLTAIYVTHDQEEALDISDRIAVMDSGNVAQIGTPREIYETPVNSFVADFIGKANFLSGHVGSDGRFQTKSGKVIDVPLRLECQADQARCAFLRPENVEIGDLATSHLRGHVSDISYFGSFFRYLVTLEDGQKMMVETRSEVTSGQEVGLHLPSLTAFPTLPRKDD